MSLFLFLLVSGLAAASACGSSWTFLFTFGPLVYDWPFQDGVSVVGYSNCQNASAFCVSLTLILEIDGVNASMLSLTP